MTRLADVIVPQVQPDQGDTDNSGDPFEHLWCCDPNTSMCGIDISNDEDVDEEVELASPCPLCEVLLSARQGCARPGCRVNPPSTP